MRVLVTGASGHIGSAVTAELVAAGHQVVAVVRSEASAEAVHQLGADSLFGDVQMPDPWINITDDVDAVIHLAYDNQSVRTGGVASAAEADLLVVNALGDALAGSGKTLIGIGIAPTGNKSLDAVLEFNPRTRVSEAITTLNDDGVRAILVAIPPVTHSDRDRTGFVPILIDTARRTGVSGYPGAGDNHWPAVHTLDLAVAFRLALEKAPPKSQLFAAAEPGVRLRDIAETIGRQLGLAPVSIPDVDVAAHFAPFPFATLDLVLPNEGTRSLLGWNPTHLSLIDDIRAGHYFERTSKP